MADFIIIRGRSVSSVNAETPSARRWLRVAFAVDGNNAACLTVQSDYIEDITKTLEDEGWEVISR